MYCSSTPSSFVKGRFALKPLTNPGVKLFCVQANCPTSCIDTGSCHKCLCFLDIPNKEELKAIDKYEKGDMEFVDFESFANEMGVEF